MSRDVIVTSENAGYLQNASIGPHRFQVDEPVEVGGCDAGPDPYELLLTALGACTAMTIRMYANRKQWPLEAVRVRLMHEKIHAEDCLDCETEEGFVEGIEREILLGGNLTDGQRQRLLQIANKCPVHRPLTSNKYRDPTARRPLVRANRYLSAFREPLGRVFSCSYGLTKFFHWRWLLLAKRYRSGTDLHLLVNGGLGSTHFVVEARLQRLTEGPNQC